MNYDKLLTNNHNVEVESFADTLAVPLVGQVRKTNVTGKLPANNVSAIIYGCRRARCCKSKLARECFGASIMWFSPDGGGELIAAGEAVPFEAIQSTKVSPQGHCKNDLSACQNFQGASCQGRQSRLIP